MTEQHEQTARDDAQYHTYSSHYIPWFVRGMWIIFWVALVWYIVRFAIPAAKDYF